MTEWLVLQLYGPMASWGDIAVGEYRPSADRPARSAIIGLIAASLGVRYDEQDKLDAITKGYLISYRLEDEGIPIRDYHTTHVPSSGTGKNRRVFLTRREELMAPERDISTILSSRDYRCDVRVTVFITATVDAPFFLRDLIVPLQNPAFVLYLGRKSCPLALPLNPRVVEADSLSEACSLVPRCHCLYREENAPGQGFSGKKGCRQDFLSSRALSGGTSRYPGEEGSLRTVWSISGLSGGRGDGVPFKGNASS